MLDERRPADGPDAELPATIASAGLLEVKCEAKRRKVRLLILPTVEAIEELKQHRADTNAILHVTC